jgi:hypothetical protein
MAVTILALVVFIVVDDDDEGGSECIGGCDGGSFIVETCVKL